jgi:hypothetical protein
LKKLLLGAFKRTRCYRLQEIFLSCHARIGLMERETPCFRLSFTSNLMGFLLLLLLLLFHPFLFPGARDETQTKMGRLASPGEGPHSYTQRKAGSRWGDCSWCL